MQIELTRSPAVRRLLKSRWPQLTILTLLLGGFLLAIASGWAGTPVGSANFGIIFVWIAWWALLILLVVPLTGRGWCAICPIPAPGEWLQRRAVLEPTERKPGWPHYRWPKRLRNIWLQNLSFMLLALFSAVILTTPRATAIVLAAMLFLALGLSLIFERRSFCRYLCPVSGFIGLYSQAAPLELRVRDKRLCRSCEDKPCYNGSEKGHGCPWQVFPGGLARNTSCGLCLECLRTCPKDNIVLQTRPFGADLRQPSRKMDEAFKAFLMVGAAVAYTGILLGPWGGLKQAAYRAGSLAWGGYAAAFLAFTWLLIPGFFALAVGAGQRIARNTQPLRPAFTAFTAGLIPLGLAFWAAFSLSFVMANATYVLSALSDPFGWGWNLFGTAGLAWKPLPMGLLPSLQVLILVGGLLWSIRTIQRTGAELKTSSLPVAVFQAGLTCLMLGLLL